LSSITKQLLEEASEKDFQEANRRAALVHSYLKKEPLPHPTVKERTLRSFVTRYKMAEALHGAGYVGLLPREHRKGNRKRKLPEDTYRLTLEFIERDYETVKQKTKYAAYAALLLASQDRGVKPPSYKTFIELLKQRPRYEQTLKRQGRRSAYRHEPFYWELEQTTPRHGDRPFEIGHIDHTELDIELRCSQTGRNLGRPWMSLLTDAFSRRELVVYLTYDPPSYRSTMMVLRECVRRHGRLPQILVLDGGPEFRSTYFETLLARYECTQKIRPAAKARFGSVCERLFGTANTHLIHNLAGNTQLMRNVRQVTQSVNPRNLAVWTLESLSNYLCEWAYEVYDTMEHPALGQSPREAFLAGLARSGVRTHRLIAYDDNFLILTLPTTRKGTAKVFPGRGIKSGGLYYWSDSFRDPAVEQSTVPVRYDPWDAGTAYAYVRNQWVQCHSEYFVVLQGRSQRELMIAAAELRQRHSLHSKNFMISARTLAGFLKSVESEEVLLTQRLMDNETRRANTLPVSAWATKIRRSEEEDPDHSNIAAHASSGLRTSQELANDLDFLEEY
jgi:transposase InsO family protein